MTTTTLSADFEVAADGKVAGALDRGALVERFLELQPVLGRSLGAHLPTDRREELGSITCHQMQVVMRLGPEPPTMRELARELDVSESAATAAADRLVRQGLAVRQAHPGDRRVVRLALSDRGREFTEMFREARRHQIEQAFTVLSDSQVLAFVDVLETLASAAADARPVGTSTTGSRP